MPLTVQDAARRLSVSPQTIRRWTASGLLPCTRTAGGHRRIREEDVQELAQLLAGSDRVAAREARERELEVLVETAIALTSELEVGDLLREIARRLTALMACSYCGISSHDEATDTVVMLADFDDRGRRLPLMRPYPLARFPCTRTVLDEQRPIVVNVSDRGADAAEVAELIAGGDKSLLMVPLVHGGRSIGLLELMDKDRERRYSRQELRLCTAVAGQAAVALHNAQTFSAVRKEERRADSPQALTALRDRLPELLGASSAAPVLRTTAELACTLSGALSCTATAGEFAAGATSPAASAITPVRHATVHVAGGPPDSGLTLVTSLTEPPTDVDAAFLDLLAHLAAAVLQRQPPGSR